MVLCVASWRETLTCNEDRVALTTRNLLDGDVVRAKARQVVQGASLGHLLTKTELAIPV